MDLQEVVNLVGGGVAVSTLLAVIVMVARGSLVPGSHHQEVRESHQSRYDQMRDDRDFWRDAALESMNLLGASLRSPKGDTT